MSRWGSASTLWGGSGDAAAGSLNQHHVTLGGVGLLLARGGYDRSIAQQFAAKLVTDALTSDARLGEQEVLLDDWSGGEGYLRYDPETPNRYRQGFGIDVYTEPGAVQLGPHVVTAQSTAFNELTVAYPYGGSLYVGTSDGKIYSWNGSSWSLSHDTGKAGGIRSMTTYQNRLYVGTGTDGAVFKFDGTTWSTAFTAASSTGVYAMTTHYRQAAQYLYIGSEAGGANDMARIHFWDDSALSLGQLDTEEPRVSVAAVLGEYCYFVGVDTAARRSSVYSVDQSTSGGQWRHHVSMPGVTIVSGAVFNDLLYLGDANDGKIYSWDGENLTLVHQLGSDAAPYTTAIRGISVWRGALWIFAPDTSGGTLGLMRYDGTSWSRPISGLTGTTPTGLAQYAGQLYMLTAATGAAQLYRTNGTIRASGEVESGLIDARLSGTSKLWRGVTVSHSALVSGQSVTVQYKLEDSGSWTTLGTNSTVGSTSADFDFSSTITANLIAFRILLAGTAGSSSPLKVYGLSARYHPQPAAKLTWSLSVRLEGTDSRKMTRIDGSDETMTGEQISAAIWDLIDVNEPVVFTDIDGQEYDVLIDEYREQLAPSLPQINAGSVGWELAGQLRLIQV
jgi:hypothetical protein